MQRHNMWPRSLLFHAVVKKHYRLHCLQPGRSLVKNLNGDVKQKQNAFKVSAVTEEKQNLPFWLTPLWPYHVGQLLVGPCCSHGGRCTHEGFI